MRIVIAGAGPIGLYLAIMLKRMTQGTAHEIVVLDKRAGSYTRPGIVAKQAVEAMERGLNLQISGISSANDTGEAIFIRDLEKALFKIAAQLNIQFIKENFQALNGKRVNPNSIDLEADFIFDCTGKPRHVVSYLNEMSPTNKPFHSVRIADNPHKSHFIANVAFDTNDLHKLRTRNERDINPMSHALAMARLKDRFKWDSYSEPDLALYPMPEMYDYKKVYYLYFEIPDSLSAENASVKAAWLQSLLALKTGHDNIEFTVLEGPMSFIPFLVDPHLLKETHARASSDGPIVIPAGDAQIEQDYRMGIAILFGVMRLNALFSALRVDRNEIQYIPELYEAQLAPMLDYQTKNLVSEYKHLSDKMIASLNRELKLFETALLRTEDDHIRLTLTTHIANIYLLKAKVELAGAAQHKPVATTQSKPYKHDIEQYQAIVDKAAEYLDSFQKYLKIPNDRFTMQIATAIKDVGNLYHSINCNREAIECYKKAIEIIESNLIHHDTDKTKLSCLSNIMVCINKTDQHNRDDVNYANQFVQRIVNHDLERDTLVKMANSACLIYFRELKHTTTDTISASEIDKCNLINRNINELIRVIKLHAHTKDQLAALGKLEKMNAALTEGNNSQNPTHSGTSSKMQ